MTIVFPIERLLIIHIHIIIYIHSAYTYPPYGERLWPYPSSISSATLSIRPDNSPVPRKFSLEGICSLEAVFKTGVPVRPGDMWRYVKILRLLSFPEAASLGIKFELWLSWLLRFQDLPSDPSVVALAGKALAEKRRQWRHWNVPWINIASHTGHTSDSIHQMKQWSNNLEIEMLGIAGTDALHPRIFVRLELLYVTRRCIARHTE